MKPLAIKNRIKEAFGRRFKRRGSSVSQNDAIKATISWPVGRGDDLTAYDTHVSRGLGLGFFKNNAHGDGFPPAVTPVRNRGDGLLFMKDIDDLPLGQYFTIQYLPTLIAVLYGIAWSIVDLDCKRLEPFYDLSKETGASSDALFLEYQYQFPLFVPFRALFKRHWSVFLSSTIFLTATIIVTPLQSSILATVDKTSEFETTFNIIAQFLPLNGSDSALTPEFLFTEYTISRLNGSLPKFTADGNSFLPVVPYGESRDEQFTLSSGGDIRKGDQTATVAHVVSHQFEDDICNITSALTLDKEGGAPGVTYGYTWGRPWQIDQWCGFKNTTTLAIIGQFNRTDGIVRLKSVLCELRGVQEFQQDVVINATTRAILERKSTPILRRYIRKEDIDLVPFDAALFNRGTQEVLGSDISVFANTNIKAEDTLFDGKIPEEALLNAPVLREAAEQTYRHFFSLAMSTSPAFLTPHNSTTFGTVLVQGQAVVIDRSFAIVSDIFLGLVLLMGVILCAYSYQRDSTLKSDPDSLSATMALIAQSDLPSKFNGLDRASTKTLKTNFGESKINLGYWENPSGGLIYKLDELSVSQSLATVLEPIWASINRDISVLQPFYNLLKRNISAGRSLSLKYQTIPAVLVARSLVAHDFLLSVVSFMTVLVSLLAVTLPGIFFEDIRAVKTSMNFQPQVVKPMVPSEFYYWEKGFSEYMRQRGAFLDPFAAARANLSDNIPLPPWSTREHMFLPVKPAPGLNATLDFDFYRTTTLGFSGSMECRPVINGTNGERIYYNHNNATTTAFLKIPNTLGGNLSDLVPCGTVFGYKPPSLRETSPDYHNVTFGRWPFPTISNYGELYKDTSEDDNKLVYISANKSDYFAEKERRQNTGEELCSNLVPVAWSHRLYSRGAERYVLDAEPRQTLLVCQPKVTVANFSIEVDRLGNVHTYKKIGNSTEIDDYLEPGFSKEWFDKVLPSIFRPSIWNPGFRIQDWGGLLMTRLAKHETDYFDPVELGNLASEAFALAFSTFAARNKEELFLEGNTDSDREYMTGSVYKYEKRVVMSPPLTFVSLAILGLFCCTLVSVYIFRRKRYLPRQPSSLASMIAYCQDSTLLDDLADTWGMSTVRRQEVLEILGHTYGFGWYQGRDGIRRLGVDKEPLIDSYNPS
ncbi:hypothetical protein TWF173_003087 [Orbilia oligospora]|nr:hypothetical protein TWF173_003087 [Orbilia oligospora]